MRVRIYRPNGKVLVYELYRHSIPTVPAIWIYILHAEYWFAKTGKRGHHAAA